MNAEQVPLIQDVKKIAEEKVAPQDYQHQIDRWNRYQEALFKVNMQCQIQNLRFRRKIVTSYSERRMKNIRQAAGIALLVAAITVIATSYTNFILFEKPMWVTENYYRSTESFTWLDWEPRISVSDAVWSVVGSSVAVFVYTALVAIAFRWNRGPLPEVIKFKSTAKIHYDELYFVQRYIRGMQKEKQDPKIELPSLEMEIPKAWLSQQSLLKVMDSMSQISLK